MGMLRLKADLEMDSGHRPASYPDYIIARLKLEGRSLRWLAEQTGISRSRMQRLLHGDPDQRKPLKIDEKQVIFAVLNIDDYVAALTTELMGLGKDDEFTSNVKIADMLSVMFRGLACKVANAIRHIEGFDSSDIRPEHGAIMREAVVRTIRNNCEDIARRRGLRLDELLRNDQA